MKLPQKIGAGLTFNRLADLAGYPAPDWSLSIQLRGPSVITLEAEPEGRQHRVIVGADVTGTWRPGRYWYSARVTRGFEVIEVASGSIMVEADLAKAGADYDARSHAERCLANIEAVLEKRSTLDQDRYKINNRELYRTPVEQLIKLRDLYRSEVRRERMASSGQSPFGQVVRVRLQ